MTVQGKVAIVTGAGQGIGLEICRKLAFDGASVILNDQDQDLANRAAASIRLENGICISVSGDSSEAEVIDQMVRLAVGEFGCLDIAIANAGVTCFGPFGNFSRADFQRVQQVNQAGTFFLAQAASNQMIRQGRGGSLLFMSSVVGNRAHRNLAAYAMSKAAIQMLAKNLVIELSGYGININTVSPGATLTERTMEDPDYQKTWAELTPMGRAGTVKDVAHAAVFLVSEEGRHITGQNLVVDGGWSAISPNP
jgi:NAD(P)-dependent dehydrogenase (short-subunit alcohol dehydrogenase family)